MLPLYILHQISAFVSFAFCFITGIRALSLNYKSPLNRLFFLVCLSLSIWISSLMISGVSPDYETALFWRRAAAIGWSSLYGLLLHFILALSKGEEILKKKSLYLLYLPAIVCILVFSIISYTVVREYHLVLTDYGWANVSVSSFWDSFFYIYFLTYSAATFMTLLLWGCRNSKKVKRKAIKIAITFIGAIGFGTFFELILNKILITKIPSIAHLFIVMPIAFLFYEIRGNHGMAQSDESKQANKGIILSDFEQLRFYQYLGGLFLMISIFYMGIQTVLFSDHYNNVQFSLSLFIMGTAIFFLPRLVPDTRHRDNIMVITVNTSILMINYFLSEQGIFHITWTFPIPIIFISILYNKRQLLYSVATVSILGNLWLMIMSDESLSSEIFLIFLPRILFFAITAYIASYIHRVYLNRLNENEIQIEYQKMISLISSKLVSINEENKADRFESILADLGNFSKARESFLICYGRDNRTVEKIYYWVKDQNSSNWEVPADFSEYKSVQLLDLIMNKSLIVIDNMDLLSSEFHWIKEILHPSVKSLIALSETSEGRIHSILGLNFSKAAVISHEDEIKQLLRIPSNLVGDGLLKIDNEQKINFMAFYDALTGLPNRSLFYDRLEKAIALAERTDKIVAVILMDLDSFKNINDSMGHDAGDLLLRRVAEILSGKIRDYDTMSRFGGDEFLFILSQLHTQDEAASIADKLLKALAKPINIAGEDFHITGSMGISCYPGDAEGSEQLFKKADIAMYFSKEHGKNRYSFFNPEMNSCADEKLKLSNELYRALERDEFVLNYQPQMDIEGTEMIGMEALIRWNHPEKGIIPPLDFIPLAEDIGLINEIGQWVLNKACRDNKNLQKRGFKAIRVAVNLSLKQFSDSSLTEMVKEILVQSELKPEYLELEITESIAMGDFVNVQLVLQELSDLGVILSIDDFGTEYSSLSRLKQLPVDRIKIDKQFIQGISLNTHDESITSFIIALSKSMELKVIAEGVENNEQISFLREKFCDEIQGYYYYKPMAYDKLVDIIKGSARG